MEVSVTTATSLATNEEFPKPKNLNDNSMMKKRSITTSIFPKLNIPTSLKRKGGQKVDFDRKAVIAATYMDAMRNCKHEQCISESSKHDFAQTSCLRAISGYCARHQQRKWAFSAQ